MTILLLCWLGTPTHAAAGAPTVPPAATWAEPYLSVLQDAAKGANLQTAAAWALAQLGDPEATKILETTFRRNPRDDYARMALIALGDRARRDQALSDFAEMSPVVATTLGFVLVTSQDTRVIARLREIWQNAEEDPLVCLWAATALVRGGSAEALPFVETALGGQSAYATTIAAAGLIERGHPAARPKLLETLKGESEAARAVAAFALGRHPDPAQLPALEAAWGRATDPAERIWLAFAILHQREFRLADGNKPPMAHAVGGSESR